MNGILLVGFSLLAAEPPSVGELHQRVSPALVAQARASAEDHPRYVPAALALCDLYAEVRGHDGYAKSALLQGDAAKMRRRLLRTADRLERRLERDGVPRPAARESRSPTDSRRTAISDAAAIAPSAVRPPPGGAGGGAVPDAGWWLVDLIRRTVSPDFWATAGGPGTIRYFALRRVLVVRGTTEVHDQMRALLRALRGR